MRKRVIGHAVWVLALVVGLLAGAQPSSADPKNEVYVLGDSLSDTGNLYEFTGWFPKLPYEQQFSNGKVWAEYFAEQLGVPLDSRAYGGAFTGAVQIPGINRPFFNLNNIQYLPVFWAQTLPGIPQEVQTLLADHPEGLNPDGLYVVWAGANEVFLSLSPGMDESFRDFLFHYAAENLKGVVCTLSEAGARHFVVANLPDLGLTPLGRDISQPFVTQAAYDFNAALAESLDELPAECGVTPLRLDAYSALQNIVAKASTYGLENVIDRCVIKQSGYPLPVDAPSVDLNPACAANPDGFLFWDDVHPTTAGHALFAEVFRAAFCGTGDQHPGLRDQPETQPPPLWRGACYGSR